MSQTQTKPAEEGEDIVVEIVDDTPEADRGRTRAPDSTENDNDIAEPDEINQYKADAQKRIRDLTRKTHDERRAKEAAVRERTEAENIAKHAIEENKRLRQMAGSSENLMIEQAKVRASTQIEALKRDAKLALENGETEKFVDTQEKLQRAVNEHEQYMRYRPAEPEREEPRQQQRQEPPRQQQAPELPEPNEQQKAFLKRNSWFDAQGDIEHDMTGYSFALHNRLVNIQGMDANSEEYYREIETGVRRRFPEYFANEKREVARDATPRTTTVVASASRSGGGGSRTVRLTSSQEALIKRMGISREAYAAQYLKDYGNG